MMRLPRWTSSHGEMNDAVVEELDFVDADDVDVVDAGRIQKSSGLQVSRRGVTTAASWVCGAVAGDGGAVVAEVDVGFEAGDALAGDAGTLEAADELFGFAGEHGAGDDFDAAGGGVGHFEMVKGIVCGFSGVNCLAWWSGVFTGGFAKKRDFLRGNLW